jgi:hypothetical protein
MTPFYRIMLWLAEFELAIALSTGRNPKHLEALRADVTRWERALEDAEIRARFG